MGRCDESWLAVEGVVGVVHGRNALQGLHHRVPDDVGVGHLSAAGSAEVIVDHYALVDEQLDRKGPDARRSRHRQRDVHVLRGPRGSSAHGGLHRLFDRDARSIGRARRIGGHAATRSRRARPDLLGLWWLLDRWRTARGRLVLRLGRGWGLRPGWCRSCCRAARRPAVGGRFDRRAALRLPCCGGAVACVRAWCAMRLEVLCPRLVHRTGVSGVLLVHLLEQPVVGAEVGFRGRAGS